LLLRALVSVTSVYHRRVKEVGNLVKYVYQRLINNRAYRDFFVCANFKNSVQIRFILGTTTFLLSFFLFRFRDNKVLAVTVPSIKAFSKNSVKLFFLNCRELHGMRYVMSCVILVCLYFSFIAIFQFSPEDDIMRC
jgi:hypothetical protein